MLQTMEEIKKADMIPGMIINGVDNANLLSVDSTTPITTDADIVKDDEKKAEVAKELEKVAEGKEVEKKEEVKKAEGELSKPPAESTEHDKDKSKEKEVDDLKDPVEKRIGKLTKKWRTTERERDFEKAKRLEAESELAKLKSQIPATDKPKREDFEDDDMFFEALTDWKIDTRMRSQHEVVAKKTDEEAEKQAAEEIEHELEEISERGRDSHEDYNTVVFDKDLVLTQGMVETIIHSDIAEEILYYLGKNPDISAAIGGMTALKAAKEIGRIEARLVEGEKKEEKKVDSPAPAKKLTQTPEPIEPVRSTGTTEKDPSQMTPKEYRAWRERNKE